jgi:NRAMP (natural resistance-associated macrophage protein)-like metal ion transporter
LKNDTCKKKRREDRVTPLGRILGPGLITGAANDDPSSIATFSQSGAQFGYHQLWIILFLYPLLTAVQELSARIGAVTGKGISAIIREHYGVKVLFPAVLLVGVANTINLGADIGAIAEATHLLVPVRPIILTVLYCLGILLLQIFVSYKLYARILKYLALCLLAYPITLFMIGESWVRLLFATFVPHIESSPGFLFMIVAAIGTTISPYMFFWQASEEVEEAADGRLSRKGPCISKGFIRNIRVDTAVGMLVSQITFWAITAVAAGVFARSGITNINTAAEAARALEPLVEGFPHSGAIAKSIFTVGIVGLGLLAVPILAGSASYALGEAFKCKVGLSLKFREAPCFYSVIILAMIIGLGLNLTGINPIKALIFSSVVNGVCSIPLLYLLARVGRNRAIMGRYRSGRLSNTVVWLAFAAMAAASVAMFVSLVY